ncbi:MAG TPA: M23 family metallopeptidase [Myxococcota bacterium]|nr:M23 family metallopeptidase [Myxococcota bacterium]
MANSTERGPEDTLTLMIVPGQSGAIRRFHVPRLWLRRATLAGVGLAVALLALSIDYVRVRVNLHELDHLRVETAEQREQIQAYAEKMEVISTKLGRIDGFERKLRIITNLDPADPLPLPGIGGTDGGMLSADDVTWMSRAKRHEVMKEGLDTLANAMDAQDETLQGLIHHLEDQSARLVHTPSVAPTHGWITSGFGFRMSPYTGEREFHKGLDIAGRMGTPIYAAADGEVIYATQKKSLGYAVKLRHGYGIETVYGHMQETLVKPGEAVKRGQQIGLMGSTGRSTGPHVHYAVLVNGKGVNPRNYILD